MRKIYTLIMSFMILSFTMNAQNILTENFDDVATMVSTGGWIQNNQSVPLGVEIWHNGVGLSIPAHNGAADSYAEASFNSTDAAATGTISNWLITPAINLNNGDVISFYTTSFNNLAFPDRLELRLNTLNTTNVGTTATSVGDFTTVLLSINPNLMMDSTLYPQDYWGQFMVTVSGLTAPTTSRIAFRYFVTDGGGTGANSSTIGIDAFSIDMPVGIHNHPGLNLNLFPNPVSDRVTLSFPEVLSANGKLSLYNALGQFIKSYTVLQGQTKADIQVSNLSEGAYSFVLELPGSVTRKVFIKD